MPDHGSTDASTFDRRSFVRAIAGAGAVGLAGCTGGDGGGGNGDGGGDGGATPTATPTSTPMGDSTATPGESYEVEDKLVIYSPIPDDIIPWFEEETGIEVELVTGVGPKIVARFFQEQRSGEYQADLLYGPTSTYVPQPDTTIKHTRPITEFDVDRQEVMPDGLYEKWANKMPEELFERLMPNHTLTNRVFTVSEDLDDLPTSYDALLESRFKGNLVAQPFFMDTNAAILDKVMDSTEAAKSYLQSLKDQELLIQVKEVQPILEGRATVAFLATDSGGTITRMSQGAPITVTIPEEGVPKTGAGYVMSKNAPHPGAARKFLELQLSEAGQKFIQGVKGGRDPIRPEIRHGNDRMRQLLKDANRFPMMLTKEEIDTYASLAKEVWPDIAV